VVETDLPHPSLAQQHVFAPISCMLLIFRGECETGNRNTNFIIFVQNFTSKVLSIASKFSLIILYRKDRLVFRKLHYVKYIS